MVRSWVESPQPLRGLGLLSAAAFTVAVGALAVRFDALTRMAFGALGVSGVLAGLTLTMDLNGTAAHVTGPVEAGLDAAAGYRTVAAHPLYARVAGALFVIVGSGLLLVAATAPTL